MSTDNGVYVASFPDGYRVCEAQAIENIDYFPEFSAERKQILKEYFGGSKVYPTLEEAFKVSHEMEVETLKDFGILEYGVSYIGEYESWDEPPKSYEEVVAYEEGILRDKIRKVLLNFHKKNDGLTFSEAENEIHSLIQGEKYV